MKYKRGQKLKRKTYGVCYYFSEMYGGKAIIELRKNNKFVDRVSAKYEDLEEV